MLKNEKAERLMDYAVHESLAGGAVILQAVVESVYRDIGLFWRDASDIPLPQAVSDKIRQKQADGKVEIGFDEFGRATFSNITAN